MLPCVVIVNDSQGHLVGRPSPTHNPELTVLETKLRPMLKVYNRTSVEGETLYGMREGLMFFDEAGHKQRIWRDDYTGAMEEIIKRLEAITDKTKFVLEKYQARFNEDME